MYKRILLKLSGEQLAGGKDFGIRRSVVALLANDIKKAVEAGTQVAIVVGGGNFMRGATFAGKGVERATADYMGMMATIMNGLALMDLLEDSGVPARLQTNIHMNQVAEPFIRRRAIRHMEKGRVVIVAGGTGKPYVTTDTAAVSAALELDCEILIKATKVDGVYDKDPVKHKDAKKYDKLSFQEAVEINDINVMDQAAMGLALEQNMPIIVLGLHDSHALVRAVNDEAVGTIIS